MELASLKRVLAMLALPLSIAPVLLLGPSLLRAPVTLLHEVEGDVARLNPFATDAAFAAAPRALGTAFGQAAYGGALSILDDPARARAHARTRARESASTTNISSKANPCTDKAPRRPRLRRLAGARVRLSWSSPAGSAPEAYRVMRSGHTVAQTTHTAMVVNVRLGKSTTFTIQARYSSSPASCPTQLRRLLAFRPPGRVSKLRILARVFGGVRIGWRGASAGDAPVAGYRIRRDGAVLAQTRGKSFIVKLSPARAHRITVAGVDTRGRVGPQSKALTIGAGTPPAVPQGTAPPSTPGALSVSEVGDAGATLYWLASTPGAAKIVGYRVYRDGSLVGQTAQTTMRLSHLSSLHTYLVTVAAVDAAKRESPRSAPFHLSTTHTPPDGPTQLAALKVTDTSATLAWSAGSANSGRLVGYLLFEDGKPERVVSGQSATVTLASERHYTFAVRALDSAGYLSDPSPDLEVFTTHTPPPAPTSLKASEVTAQSAKVSWSPSTAVSGRIVGYRVFRNDVPVGQSGGPEMTLTSLAPSTVYQVTVEAVDSLGAISRLTAPLSIQTEDPTPTHGNVQAFLLASTDQSFDDLEAHYQQIGVVYPTYFNCGMKGLVTGQNDPLVTGWAEARQVAVMPRLNCQNPVDEDQILNEPAAQEATIDQLATLGQTYGYQGFQIDFEGAQPSERNAFTAFITALAERLHAQGEKLSTIVTAKYYNIQSGRAAMYDDAALSVPSDYIFVLDWGLHWTTSAPGALDELGWFTRVADYTATLPNKSKFVLGMPMYGIDWPAGGGSANPGTPLEYENVMALAREFGATPEWEATAGDPHFSYVDESGVGHSVWYTDQQSIGIRVALAQSLGLGVGLWHLGSEDQSVWALPTLGGSG
jgi:spore germination protein YaaH